MIRTVTLAALLLAASVVSAVAQKDEKPRTYKTPQDVFDAVLAAREKRDARIMIGCFVPEAQGQIAAGHAAQGLFFRAQAEGQLIKDKDKDKSNEKLVKKYKPLFDVLDKHGLSEKATKDLKVKGFRPTKQEREAILKLMKDPAAFAADYMLAYDKVEPPKDRKDDPIPKLTDVKIDGNKASANVTVTLTRKENDKTLSREVKQPVTFRKIDGSWRIEPEPEPVEVPKDKDKPKDGASKDK